MVWFVDKPYLESLDLHGYDATAIGERLQMPVEGACSPPDAPKWRAIAIEWRAIVEPGARPSRWAW